MMNPFRGYSESNVRLLISQGMTTDYYATLWANFEIVFNQLETEFPDIYNMNPVAINEKVKEKTLEIIAEMKVAADEAAKQEALSNPYQTVNQN
jgi:hypothetical protein